MMVIKYMHNYILPNTVNKMHGKWMSKWGRCI